MLFSIIIPTFNYADYLESALHSILKQKYHNYEVIVVDDGSTDHTPSVLNTFQDKFADKLHIIQQANQGPGKARNAGIERATGKFLLFLDSDDTLTDDALILLRRAIADNPEANLVIAGHNSNNQGKMKTYPGQALSDDAFTNVSDYLRKAITLCNGAMVVSRELTKKVHFPEHIRLCEDIPFFMQVLTLAQPASIEEAVVTIRKHVFSRRGDVDGLLTALDDLPGLVFNPDVMPESFYILKREFRARLYLRAFRGLYSLDRYREARHFYYKAVKIYPKALLLRNYSAKWIKSFCHFRQSPVEALV